MPDKHSLFDCSDCLLKALCCQYLTPTDFEIVRRTSVQLRYRKGENMAKQGAKANHLIFLHRGIVKFNYEYETGKDFIVTIVPGPKLLGGANMFFKEMNLFSLVAVEDSDVCLIDSRAFKSMVKDQGRLLMRLFEEATEMFQASVFNFISLAHKQVNGRIADILIYLSEHVYKSREFTLTLTRKELAEFAACSHENVIITLSRMNREGVISLDKKTLKINDLVKLHQISKHG